jgi:hypothetical protein
MKSGLAQVSVVMAENEILTKTIETLKPGMEELVKRVKSLEDQPMPPKGVTKVITAPDKGMDGVVDEPGTVTKITSSDALAEALSGLSQDDINKGLMKLALRQGRAVGG